MRAALLEDNKPLNVIDDLTVSRPRAGRVPVRHCGICL
jgi:hypothetical protein